MNKRLHSGELIKNITILGSTGSIGTQALEVVRANPLLFKIIALTAHSNTQLLIEQALEFQPEYIVITEENCYQVLEKALSNLNIEILSGVDALEEVASLENVDIVLTALVGFAGLIPTIAAIKSGKDIALANKETLVVAGDLITKLAKEFDVKILPVDSEHSAIFQCLVGEEKNPIEKIFLTASGGPFRGKNIEFLSKVTRHEALKHPNWVMGAKITIDSATLMNKGLEVIEAKWLFDLDASQIDVVVHPQSIIHSLVQFEDGSLKAQMGLPDMKLPIQYALAFPQRIKNDFPRLNFADFQSLSFEKPDTETFRNLNLAFQALRTGGNMPCVLNAANEVVVAEFLNSRIGFLEMSSVIEECMQKINFVHHPSLDDYLKTDDETRKLAAELVTKW